MKVEWRMFEDDLVDPVDHSSLRLQGTDRLVSATGREYTFVRGQPVLLPAEPLVSGGWQYPTITVNDSDRPKPSRTSGWGRRIQGLLRRLVGKQGAGSRFVSALTATPTTARRRVLVVGGASIGHGCAPLLDASDIDVIAFDVYPTDATSFVADAHRIPLQNDAVDAVWIQAVLEHVYRPEIVVAEITRVLRPSGLVYAESPFLQPIHEGAYDYVRFNISGHRMLWSGFEEVESGVLGGPGAVANLAIRGLVGGLTRSAALARMAYAATLPLTLVDRIVSPRWKSDYATGVYFLGRLDDQPRSFDPTAVYEGAL